MVERSLEQLAADRGVTICFADLDGADGLWVAEERTILVNKGLSERQAVEVLEHELAHVDIDDGHAAVDASVHRRPSRSARWAAVLSAAVSVGLLTGVYFTVTNDTNTAVQQQRQEQAPASADVPGPARSPGSTSAPPVTVRTEIVAGPVRISTVTVTPSSPPPPAVTATPIRVSSSTAPAAPAVDTAGPTATALTPSTVAVSPTPVDTTTAAPADTAQAVPTG